MVATLWSPVGSPPHTRGKGTPVIASQGTEGIPPARAGKSRFEEHRWTLPRDHPRTRGEKNVGTTAAAKLKGSPPHARGKAGPQAVPTLRIGITPARAGKRSVMIVGSVLTKDHPRTRGEKRLKWRFTAAQSGSPPHARGKGRHFLLKFIYLGITPARAGKRCLAHLLLPTQEDHPRTRGEKM